TKAFELSVAASLGAPGRKDLTIGTELHDSITTRIDTINRIIRANSNPARTVQARCPRSDECPVGREVLNAVLEAYLRDINVAAAISCDSIGRVKLSYVRNECAGWREFFYSPIAGVGDQNVSVGINSNRSRRIKFSFPGALATFEHVSHIFRQRTELGRWRVGYLINDHSVVIGRLVHL